MQTVSSSLWYRWFWTVIGLRPLPVASQKVSDTFPRKSVRHFYAKKCLTLLAFALLAVPAAYADKPAASAEKIETKEVQGPLVMVKRHMISVETHADKETRTSTELLLPLHKDLKLERVKSFSELKPGDIVRVKYANTYRAGQDGKLVPFETKATVISLVRNATPSGLTSRETP